MTALTNGYWYTLKMMAIFEGEIEAFSAVIGECGLGTFRRVDKVSRPTADLRSRDQ
jgi:hypothetical protein